MTNDRSNTMALESSAPAATETASDLTDHGAWHDEQKLRREIDQRIAALLSPHYSDPSTRCLDRADYLWLTLACAALPVVALLWGLSML